MKSKKKIQLTKMQTRKMTKDNKSPYTRKNRRYIGGAEPKPGFSFKLINRLLLLIEGMILKSIDKLGHVIGVDLSDPTKVSEKIAAIQGILLDPEINEQVRIIVSKIGILLTIALEAAEPYIQPMTHKLNNIYVKSTSELGVSTITIIKNIAKVIPVYGAILAMIDAANTLAVSSANTATAKEHAKMAVGDAIREMSDEFRTLLKQKKDLLSRIPTEVPDTQPLINPPVGGYR
jgi:hypothetical protein